jgi:hypothetical protein
MRLLQYIYFLLLPLPSCISDSRNKTTSTTNTDTISAPSQPAAPTPPSASPDTNVYANQRFRKVQVKKLNDDTYQVTGQGQIFEASFGWVVEDGHEELKQGHEMTSMGAPEWGDFSFTIQVSPKRRNSVMHLILFETSAMDGSRQHELPIPLK